MQGLHNGHLDLINKALDLNDNLIILLGINTTPSVKNPFTFQQRKDLILKVYPNANITILPLLDHEDDLEWVSRIERILKSLVYNLEDLTFIYVDKDKDTEVSNNLVKTLNTLTYLHSSPNLLNATDIRDLTLKSDFNTLTNFVHPYVLDFLKSNTLTLLTLNLQGK